jgi:hypothetical protein
MQCSNHSVASGLSIVPLVRRHKQRVLVLERNGVIQRVKQMVIGFDRKAGCPSHDGWAVGTRELECGEHFNITDGRLRDEARSNRRHLGQPMRRLQDLKSSTYNGFDECKCLLGIRFSCGILKQPFENHACIEDDYHDRSTDRALRTSSLVKVGRPLRATRNCRKTLSRLIWSLRSRTARRIKSAMMELLF